MRLYCPLRGFITVQLLCAQPSPTTRPISPHINSPTVLAGLGLLSPCMREVETSTTARSLLLPLVGPAGQQIHVAPSQPCSQLSLMSLKPAGATSSPGLNSVGLGAHTPRLGVPAVHRQAASSTPKLKKHCWGALERDEDL